MNHKLILPLVLCLPLAGLIGCSVKPSAKAFKQRQAQQKVEALDQEQASHEEKMANYDAGKAYTNTDCSQPKTLAGPRRLRLLSNAELRYTIKDLFGLDSAGMINLPNDVSKHMLFDHIGAERPLHLDHLKEYLAMAETIAGALDPLKIAACTPDKQSKRDEAASCLEDFLGSKGTQIWRRPLLVEEQEGLVQVFKASFDSSASASYVAAVRAVVSSMLFSPSFLYRFELGEPQADGRYKLSGYETAAAMSYLVWRSIPDERLLQLAGEGKLQDAATRRSELERMLQDEKAKRAVGDFANYWTRAFKVLGAPKDSGRFPEFTDALRKLLSEEITAFYKQVFFNDDKNARTFKEIFTADYTIGEAGLAKFYESSSEQNRIDLSHQKRLGMLGKAGLLAGYSYADTSSPIHRGVFVLENILCRPFPEPPAVTIPEVQANESNRDRFAAHSENPNCAGCHKQIDQVGFSMESFNAIGKITADNLGQANPPAGELTLDGQAITFGDANDLAQHIAGSAEAQLCHVTQWYRYAFGHREALRSEQCLLEHLGKEFEGQGGQLPEMLLSLVGTDFYIYRMNLPAQGGEK